MAGRGLAAHLEEEEAEARQDARSADAVRLLQEEIGAGFQRRGPAALPGGCPQPRGWSSRTQGPEMTFPFKQPRPVAIPPTPATPSLVGGSFLVAPGTRRSRSGTTHLPLPCVPFSPTCLCSRSPQPFPREIRAKMHGLPKGQAWRMAQSELNARGLRAEAHTIAPTNQGCRRREPGFGGFGRLALRCRKIARLHSSWPPRPVRASARTQPLIQSPDTQAEQLCAPAPGVPSRRTGMRVCSEEG